MQKKIDVLREHAQRGDWHGAIRLAGTFPRLGDAAAAIRQAREALLRPEFQRQLGRDPDVQLAAGIAALRQRYEL